MTSTDPKTRQKGFSSLKTNLPNTPPSLYKKLAYGLFFFYWHSDGPVEQENDAQAIASLLANLQNKKFILFSRAMFQALKKLWLRIDYHRNSKYLNLLNYLFEEVYKFLRLKNKARLFALWNDFLVEQIFFDTKGLLTSKGYGLPVPVYNRRHYQETRDQKFQRITGDLSACLNCGVTSSWPLQRIG